MNWEMRLLKWAYEWARYLCGELVVRYRLIRRRCTVCNLPRHLCQWMSDVERKLQKLGK